MLAILAVFGIASIAFVPLGRLIGGRVFYIATLVPLAAFAHTVLLGGRVIDGAPPFEALEWIRPLGISISMRMDTLGWVMTLIVTGVGALVMFYCRNYFRGTNEGIGRFAGVMTAFAGAMYGLVLTDDIIMLVMFWEITSILSYLLIGHAFARAAARRAALQALLTTTLGGLVMFVGAVILASVAGSTSIDALLASPPESGLIDVAVVCLLIGALSKSALFPFHYWLPGAMAAPTPVSAYLHAAAMVKAGIYLLARFTPAFADSAPWQPVIVSMGIVTMLIGGLQALREVDLKRLLAFGTVSQLGFISAVIGFGTRDTALAGIALLVGHALFKATLFLVVGIIDRQLSTRDIDKLSGVGRQAPVLAVVATIAAASMAGIPPLLGFVAKEAALTSLLDAALAGSGWGWVALSGVVVGSILTTAYAIRFVWGAFARKKTADGDAAPDTHWPDPPISFIGSPLALAAATIAGGVLAGTLDRFLSPYADTVGDGQYHLALWHGLEPALGLSAVALVLGAVAFWLSCRPGWKGRKRMLPFQANDVYAGVTRAVDRLAVFVTRIAQSGSLSIYVGTVFVVLVAAEAAALLTGDGWVVMIDAWQHPVQPIAAVLMIVAGLFAVRADKRYTGVVLVSVTGLGMIVLFASTGAPDLAVTQVLIETVTLIAFSLVLRRIPSRLGSHNGSGSRTLRALIGAAVGLTMAIVVVLAASARIHDPVSTEWGELAYEIGHGQNVVNVALVDLRGWDTMGELSVLVLAATGVASLVFITARADRIAVVRSKLRERIPSDSRRSARRRPLVETSEGLRFATQGRRGGQRAWLVGGTSMASETRSMILEVVVRILFHTIIVISIYVLFAGHNLPGGGFAGGLVAGLALVMRYVAGGRYELGIAAPTDAGYMLGAGLLLAVGTAAAPMLLGLEPLTRAVWEAELPIIGHIEFVSSTFFDIGVYLVVVGLVLDVLRSLGAEVDRQITEGTAREGAHA